MLGKHYRWHVYNGTGVSLTVTVSQEAWKYATDGSFTFGSTSDPISAASVTTLAYSNSSGVDNTTAKNQGAHGLLQATSGSSATGECALFLQRSDDDGTTWPSDGYGEKVASVWFNAETATKIDGYEVV
jgi:hypothetical protein